MGNSMSCESVLTKDCLGLSDGRYDPSVSNDLVDQDVIIWNQYAGYWGPEKRSYLLVGGQDRPATFFDPVTKSGWPYKSDAMTVYRTIMIDGSRFKQKAFYFYEPAPAEFCEQTPPEGKQNTVGDGVCGENGNYQLIEDFGVSSYEKDGTINLIWKNQGPDSDEISGPPQADTSTLAPADEYGVFAYTDMGFFTVAETFTFTGDDRNYLLATATATKHQPTDENFERIISNSFAPRMNDETAFLSALRQAFEDHKVKDIPGWLSRGEPMPNCVAEPWGSCPNETEWCGAGQDPNCSESPYQEPAAALNGWGIALVVIAVTLGSLTVASSIFYNIIRRQKKRYQTRFVEQIVEDIGHTGSTLQLGPEELAREFRRIDTSNDGNIEKEELWNFVSSGKAGIMNRKDFNALFKSMDIDGNGAVNFMEFCSFMTTCGKTYRQGSSSQILNSTDAAEEIARLIDDKKIN